MKKAQMSLEMIIGLLILLVVAVVVIRMFLGSTGNIDEPWQNVKTGLKWKEFKSECEGYCSNFKITGTKATLAKYCYTKLTGDTDLNRNAIIDSLPADTKVLEICEDGVYCFHVHECKTNTGKIDWDDCRQVVCQSYYDVYKDWDKVDEKVYELFPNEGTCNLQEDENWWNMYFGPTPCTDPGKPPSETPDIISLGACTLNLNNWYFECDDISGISTCQRGLVAVEDSTGSDDTAGNIGMALYGVEGGTVQIDTTSGKLTGTFVVDDNTNEQPQDCHELKFWCDSDWDGSSMETLNPEYEAIASSCTAP